MRTTIAAIASSLALSLGLACAPAAAQTRPGMLPDEKLLNVASRPGINMSFYALPPQGGGAASGNVILFTGGNGLIGATTGNFLLRTRDKFAAAGFFVVSAGAASDYRSGLTSAIRTSAEHAEDVAALIDWLRQRNDKPVWLIGTSNGTISAAAVAARLAKADARRRPSGLVMTSTIAPPRSAVGAPMQISIDFSAIAIPTLFVHNKEDACSGSLFANLPLVMDRFTRAPKKELIAVSGGDPPTSDACDAFSRHGYLGLEDKVIGAIIAWIKAN